MSIRFQHKLRIILILLAALGIITALVSAYIMLRAQPVQKVTLATAQRHPKIQYCNDSNADRQLDLYIPQHAGKAIPLLIFIHGGGWRGGYRGGKLAHLYGSEALGMGIAVADIGYRLNAPNPYPDENTDIACALTWLTDHAASYGINPEKTVYFGDSAGGQLAAFAALNIPFNNYDYEAPVGVIDLYGVSNFEKIIEGKNPDKNAQFYLGSSYRTHASSASPTSYITKTAPRFLIIHGTNDTVVPISQSKELFDTLTKFGVDAEFVEINGAGHGFDGNDLNPTERDKMQSNIRTFLKEVTN